MFVGNRSEDDCQNFGDLEATVHGDRVAYNLTSLLLMSVHWSILNNKYLQFSGIYVPQGVWSCSVVLDVEQKGRIGRKALSACRRERACPEAAGSQV